MSDQKQHGNFLGNFLFSFKNRLEQKKAKKRELYDKINFIFSDFFNKQYRAEIADLSVDGNCGFDRIITNALYQRLHLYEKRCREIACEQNFFSQFEWDKLIYKAAFYKLNEFVECYGLYVATYEANGGGIFDFAIKFYKIGEEPQKYYFNPELGTLSPAALATLSDRDRYNSYPISR